MSIVRVESKQKKTYLDGFFVVYQSFIPLAYISPGYFRNNAIPNLNSWIIHVFMKHSNKNGIIEKSGKQVSKTKLFRHLYYSSKHTCIEFLITSTAWVFIFMFIEKTLKIIININLHYFPPMCQCQKIKVTHEVMTNSPHWLLENGSHSGKRIGVVPKYD